MSGDLELLGERIAEQAAHLDAATHRLLTDLREFDERGGWRAQGALSCAHWLAWRVGWDLVTARERVRVARKLAEHPAIDDALRRGEVSYSKVRAMLRVATAANEPVILEHARLTTAAQLEKLTRKYALVQRHGQDARPEDDEPRRYVRRRDTDDGMVKIEAVLHPEEAELVWAMLDHAAKRLARDPQGRPAGRDSAESHETAPLHGTSAAGAPAQAHDSAESPGTAEPRDVTVAEATAIRAEISACMEDGLTASCEAARQQETASARTSNRTNDSAESAGTTDPQDMTAAEATAIRAEIFACMEDGPTASCEAARRQETPATRTSNQAHDSAESAGTTDRQDAMAVDAVIRADMSECTVAGSAESCETVSLAICAGISACMEDGPTASCEVARRQETVAARVSNQAHDSAESPCMPEQQDATTAEAPAICADMLGCAADGSAESCEVAEMQSPCEHSGGSTADAGPALYRSLLDRLLDEAEALREADILRDAAAFREADTVREVDALLEAGPRRTRRDRSASNRPSTGSVAASPRGAGLLRQKADATRRAFDRAEALVAIAQAYLRGDQPNRSPIDVMITIPAGELRGGAMDPTEVGRMGSSLVAAETVRRLSCDAGMIEVIEDEHGVPLSVGRKRRTIAGALKRALLRRDTECSFPGCTHRTFLEGHHIQHWADGGETTLENASLLCSLHHRFVHEYGYTIELGADRRPLFRDPRGRLVPAVPERPAGADANVGWAQIRAANAPLAIDAGTIACEWDGTLANYGLMIGHLVAIDGLV